MQNDLVAKAIIFEYIDNKFLIYNQLQCKVIFFKIIIENRTLKFNIKRTLNYVKPILLLSTNNSFFFIFFILGNVLRPNTSHTHTWNHRNTPKPSFVSRDLILLWIWITWNLEAVTEIWQPCDEATGLQTFCFQVVVISSLPILAAVRGRKHQRSVDVMSPSLHSDLKIPQHKLCL